MVAGEETSVNARLKPHKVRGRELEEEYGADPDGRPVLRHRVVDTSGQMLRAGTITPECTPPRSDLQAASSSRTSTRCERCRSCGCRARGESPTERAAAHARRRVHGTIQALGGISSPAARVSGMSSACSAAFGSGQSDRAGVDGQSGRSKRRGYSWRRSGCWRRTSGTLTPGEPPDGYVRDFGDRFWIEGQRSEVVGTRPQSTARLDRRADGYEPGLLVSHVFG